MVKENQNPTDTYVGSRLRLRRMMLHLSQEKLGDMLGVTFQQIQKYEKGTNRISASRLQDAARVLQVPLSFFFEGAPQLDKIAGQEPAPSPAYVLDFVRSADGIMLVKAFVEIQDAKTRRCIVNLVEAIAGQV